MSVFSLLRNRVFLLAVVALGALLVVAAACDDDEEVGETPTDETPVADETPAATPTEMLAATPTEQPDATPTEEPADGAATADIAMVPTIQFDKSELTIPAGTDVTVTADNTDDGINHNFSVYTADPDEDGESLGMTEVCTAPCTETVTLNLDAGQYFFRCDVHPQQMTGTLTVEGDGGGAGASTRY